MTINNDSNVPPISTTLNSPSSSSSSPSDVSNSFCLQISSPKTNASNLHKKKFPSPQHSNGGKPMITDLNKKLKQIGKRQPKSKAVVYQSQISDNSVGIKLCIKKSINTFKAMTNSSNTNSKSSRKRKSNKSSLSKKKGSDSDDPYVKRRKKSSNDINSSSKKSSEFEEPIEQSVWGTALPKEVLLEVSISFEFFISITNLFFKIFKMVIKDEGSIPTACRLTRVCSLWRQVALDKKLWKNIDLSTYFKEKNRTELRLKWFIENRMIGSEEINISYWKVTNTLPLLVKLFESCPGLRSISLSGWRALSCDDLNYLAENFQHLSKLDLSSINTEMNTSKTAVGLQSLVNAIEKISERLTHLNLADNRLSGIPQITQALTTHCPNLILLDLSNVKTIAVSHGMLHIEKLQEGCQKLKVLRLANSHVQLSSASLQEQMR
jgi:F-box/leucine-rich repeat protein 6